MENVQTATMEFMQTQLTAKDERIQQLEQHVQKVTQRDYNTAAELNSLRQAMKSWTTNALRDREISETNAEEISEICGFTLEQSYDVTVTVDHTFTIMVPAGEDVDDIISTIDFSAESYHTELINHDSMVSSIDYDLCD